MPQTVRELEQTLRDLPRHGTLVKDRGYRQVWRFEHGGRAYYLKFYPRGGVRDRWRRRLRGSPARREFERLQWLQKAAVPAPRAIAMLVGFRVNDRKGDAVILEAVEPAVQLDEYLNDLTLRGEPVPDWRSLAEQLRTLIYTLGKAGLGHSDLHLGNFILKGGKLYLLDAYAVRKGGLRMEHVLQLAHSVSRFATRTDLMRGWRLLRPDEGTPMPSANPVARRRYATFVQKVWGDRHGNRYFGRLRVDGGFVSGWSGVFFKQAKYPRRWSDASRQRFEAKHWLAAWPDLLRRVETGEGFEVLKRTRSGDVLAGEVELGGRKVSVVVKHPRRRYWYRYFNEIGRGSRPRRAWAKAWQLVARDLPTAWPLLLMEKRVLGYVTDSLIVFERVPGPTLFHADYGAMDAARRETLFHRAGRLLRRLERTGLTHFDAKATNFVARPDEKLGPTPVLVDVDGVRRNSRAGVARGVQRLLRHMQKVAAYTPADSLALCRGYTPFSRFGHEDEAAAGMTNDEVPNDEGMTKSE